MKILRLFLFFLMTILCIAGSAQAIPVLPTDTPIYFQYNNLEQIDTSLTNSIFITAINPLTGNSYGYDFGTCGNWGVVNISSIQTGSVATDHQDINGGPANIFFDDGIADTIGVYNTNQGQIHGIFYDIDLTSGTTATGGFMDLYYTEYTNDTIDQTDLAGSAGPTDAAVAEFTAGTFLVRFYFDTGIVKDGSNTTIQSDINVTTITGTGRSDSFASVDTTVVGAWTNILNSDWFYVSPDGTTTETRDIRFSTFFNLLEGTSSSPWPWDNDSNSLIGLRSNDPARVYTTSPVPEPGTMFLFGAGLLGLVGIVRRKKN